MRSIWHRDYVYRPWSDERRKAARERELIRLYGSLEAARWKSARGWTPPLIMNFDPIIPRSHALCDPYSAPSIATGYYIMMIVDEVIRDGVMLGGDNRFAAEVLVTSAFAGIGANERKIHIALYARWDERKIAAAGARLRKCGTWVGDNLSDDRRIAHDFEGARDDQMGASIEFVLDVMIAEGAIRVRRDRKGERLYCHAARA